jgi:hypothetical protein
MKLTSTDPVSHIKITQAGLIAALVAIVGQLAAFVPNIAQYQSTLISAGTAVIAAAFLIANAGHALAGSNVSVDDLKAGVDGFVHASLQKINFDALVKDAVDAKGIPSVPDIEATVQAEVRKLLAGALTAPAAAPAPVVPTAGQLGTTLTSS